jgi:hypothetical protein
VIGSLKDLNQAFFLTSPWLVPKYDAILVVILVSAVHHSESVNHARNPNIWNKFRTPTCSVCVKSDFIKNRHPMSVNAATEHARNVKAHRQNYAPAVI